MEMSKIMHLKIANIQGMTDAFMRRNNRNPYDLEACKAAWNMYNKGYNKNGGFSVLQENSLQQQLNLF